MSSATASSGPVRSTGCRRSRIGLPSDGYVLDVGELENNHRAFQLGFKSYLVHTAVVHQDVGRRSWGGQQHVALWPLRHPKRQTWLREQPLAGHAQLASTGVGRQRREPEDARKVRNKHGAFLVARLQEHRVACFDAGKVESSGNGKLYILNTETLQSRPLFTDPEQVKFANLMPAVSPDGKKVAFVSNRSGHFRIWLSNLDGSHARPISPAAADLDETVQLLIEQKVPSWSPDGQWIAHFEGVESDHLSRNTGRADSQKDALIEGSWNVWIVGSDGQSKRKAGHGDDPIWSPDGLLTRSFLDRTKGGANVMIQTKEGWKELPIVPPRTTRYGRFTWKPESAR
jgi:WD40-like Beta Propeller Repeat